MKVNDKLEKDKKLTLAKIKEEPNKWKRFWKYIWFALTFVWVWCWRELRDWRTFIVFVLTVLVIGSEVWISALLGIILHNSYLLGIAGTCWAFWLLPGTPFIPLCIIITTSIKALINKKKNKENNNGN